MKNLIKNKKRKIVVHVIIAFIMIFISLPSMTVYQEVEYVEAVVIFEKSVNVDIPEVEIKHYYDSLNGFAGRMPYSTYKWLEKAWFVRSINLNSNLTIISAYEPGGGGGGNDLLDWGIDDIDAERAWGGFEDTYDVLLNNPTGENVKVCIIDTGIDYNHPDLIGNYKGGYDYVDNDDDPMDESIVSHGTHVAGIIGAEDNDGGVIGVAPKVDLYAVRAFDENGFGEVLDIVAAIDWAIINEMDIISMSFYSDEEFSSVSDAISAAYQAGIVLVASSGNAPIQYDTWVRYPAALDDWVIAVGAVDIDHTRPWWSNYGYELDVVAPGVNIYSTTIGSWDYMSGTSMAAPMVAGVAALILSVNPTLSNDAVIGILKDTATYLGWEYDQYGEGLINAQFAVATAVGDTINPSLSIISPSGTVSGTVTIRVSASDAYGISKVQYKIGNGFWHNDETAPYEWQWNTNGYSDGVHTITSRAWDIHGNWAEDHKIVLVDNIPDGGCPFLSVFDGEEYIEEGLLNIHNPNGTDVVTNHTLFTTPKAVNHQYLLRLIEHPKTISHIDNVQLWGKLPNGQTVQLHLGSAVHSALGQVKWALLHSDDERVDILGADHNKGSSEFIDLEFNAPAHTNFIEFIFIIEGNNMIIK